MRRDSNWFKENESNNQFSEKEREIWQKNKGYVDKT